jgi:AcrR family transcriptional regulator
VATCLRTQRDQARKQCTRQKLLDAAARVFIRSGYHKPLISDIVAEAGVGQGTFYRNFSDKRDIFDRLLEGFISELFAEFSDMSAHLPTNVQEYRNASLAAIKRAAHIVERNQELCLLFMREAPTVDNHIAKVISGIYERFSELAKFYLDHAITKGFARPCRSDVVAQSIVGIGLQTVEAWLNGRYSDISIDELITEVVNFAFLGFGSRKSNENSMQHRRRTPYRRRKR